MTVREMKLSIIIVSWNTRELLRDCLASVFAYAPDCEFETWIVDNASSDGSQEMVRQHFPQVRLIVNGENVGFARANNQAINQSNGQYILLLNADTKVKANALQTLVAFLDGHPEAGAAGARILNGDGTLQPSCFPAPTLSRELWYLLHLDRLVPYGQYPMQAWKIDEAQAVDVLLGACLLVRREALEEAGPFDERFFMYSEEVDLCTRLKRKGWELYWAPQAQIIHYGGQSTQQVAAEMFLQLYRSKVLYFRIHYGSPTTQLYKLILLMAAVPRLLLTPLTWLVPSTRTGHYKQLATRYRRLVLSLHRF